MSYPSDVAFSPAVKAVQARLGSRQGYARLSEKGDWPERISPALAEFIAGQDSLFLATASAAGQPYVQHRGGPPGFLRVLDERTLAFADFSGNRQYISTGNLAENPRAQFFLIDYASQQRVKIWGEAHCSEDPALLRRLLPEGYPARAERAIVFTVTAWNANCPQHIPRRLPLADVEALLAQAQQRIATLEAELARRL